MATKVLLIVGLLILFVGCGPREVIIVTPTPTPRDTPPQVVLRTEDYGDFCREVLALTKDGVTYREVGRVARLRSWELAGIFTHPEGKFVIHNEFLGVYSRLESMTMFQKANPPDAEAIEARNIIRAWLVGLEDDIDWLNDETIAVLKDSGCL